MSALQLRADQILALAVKDLKRQAQLDDLGPRVTAPFLTALREVIFEQVRSESYPDLPSRHGAVFLSDSIDDALAFNSQYREGKGHIYECSLDGGSVFIGDMNWGPRSDYLNRPGNVGGSSP